MGRTAERRKETGTRCTQRLLSEANGLFFPFNQYLFPAGKSLFEIKLPVWPFEANYQMLIWMFPVPGNEEGKLLSQGSALTLWKTHTAFTSQQDEV